MFCGNFAQVDHDDQPWSPRSSSSSPSSSPPRRSSRSRKEKNPYADRGRDKFAAVLADLEARKEKIMKQVGEEDVFLVRFAQSSSRDWVPIVVKAKDPKKLKSDAVGGKKWHKSPAGSTSSDTDDHHGVMMVSAPGAHVSSSSSSSSSGGHGIRMMKKTSTSTRHVFMDMMKRPGFYWSVVLIVILLCLVMFGSRSFAIVCMSVWWYLVPTTMKGEDLTGRRLMKKSYISRGLSGKNLRATHDHDVRSSLQSKMQGQARINITERL